MKSARLLIVLVTLFSTLAHAQTERLDETWTVTVGGQTVFPNADGSFRVPNIIAVDADGDNVGDDLIRVIAIGTGPGGQAKYAYSDPFLLSQGQTFDIDVLTFSNELPAEIVRSVQIEGPDELSVGDVESLLIIATLEDGQEVPVPTEGDGTTYRSSNPSILSVTDGGIVEALAPGNAAILAMNSGASGIRSFRVLGTTLMTAVGGYVQHPNGDAAIGANVELTDGSAGTTGANGFFELQLTTLRPLADIQATTSFSDGMNEFVGRSASVVLLPDGVTDVGIIVLEPKQPPPLFGHAVFELFHNFPPFRTILDLKIGDLSGDNIADIALVGGNTGGAEIIIWTSDNGGQLAETYRSPTSPSGIALSDYDLDGDRDVVTVSSSHALYLENLGSGAWLQQSAPIEGLDPHEYPIVESQDLDRDGYPELVLAVPGRRSGAQPIVTVLRNDQGHEWVDPIQYELVGMDSIDKFFLVDVNNDQNVDVVAYFGNTFSPGFQIGFNEGGGNLSWTDLIPLASQSPFLSFNGFFSDTNGDRHLDFVTSGFETSSNSQLAVFLNVGDGLTFTEIPSSFDVIFPLAADDFDRDGTTDVVGSRYWDLNRSQFLFESTLVMGDGLGSFQAQRDMTFSSYFLGGGSGDLDGDGFPDAVLWSGQHFGVLLNNRDAGFKSETFLDIGAGGLLVAANMNDETGEDVVILRNASRSVVVANNNGDRTLTLGLPIHLGAGDFSSLHAADLNGDSILDVVLLRKTTNSNFSLVLLENDGFGGLSLATEIPIGQLSGGANLTIGNLDQDAVDELVIGGQESIRVFKQMNGFSYQEVQNSFVPNIGGVFDHADFDNDGKVDLVAEGSGEKVVLLQTLPLVFEEFERVPGNGLSQVAYLDSDKFPDLVVGQIGGTPGSTGSIRLYYGTESGLILGDEFEVGPDFGPLDLCVADLNLDSRVDVLARTPLYGGLAVLESISGGNGFAKRSYSASLIDSRLSTGGNIVVIDLDLDGDLDVLQSHQETDLLIIHENRIR